MQKTKIEWCDSSWNPITGCYHECEYCYARRIANRYRGCIESPAGQTDQTIITLPDRLKAVRKDGTVGKAAYPYGFTPTFHEYRLEELKTKKYGKTIFVCSMADMFGDWIPDEWIAKIFDTCKSVEGHRYLFLTKNPRRYMLLAASGLLPEDDRFWYGSTATDPTTEVFYSDRHHTFVSIEPILAPFDGTDGTLPATVEWAIIGAETGNRKDRIIPERSWVEPIVEAYKKYGNAVFMKDSMKPVWGDDIITEFPWSD